MNKYTIEELKNILENHTKWLNNYDGMRADLDCVDLRDFDLWRANLRMAKLRGAILSRVNLRGADLRGADLRGADLRGADLGGADLSMANLRGANLHMTDLNAANLMNADLMGADLRDAQLFRADLMDADLGGADLSMANLRGAILPDQKIMDSVCPMNCPEKGAFIGWKKSFVDLPDKSGFVIRDEVIVELQIPERAKRSSATGRKCRCNEAEVLDILSPNGVSLPKGTIAHSQHDPTFTYEVGQKLYIEDFDDDRWNECSTGIHFFITRQEAIDY